MISPELMGLPIPYGEEIMIVGRTMWTQCTSVTDRQTDRRTDRITITKTVQRRASHGKNLLKQFHALSKLQSFFERMAACVKGWTENVGPEKEGPKKNNSQTMQDWKMEDNIWGKVRRWKMQDRKMEN